MWPRATTLLARILGCAALAYTGCQQQPMPRANQGSVTFRGAGASVVSGPAFSEHLPMDVLIPPRAVEPVVLPVPPPVAGLDGRPQVIVVRAEIDRTGRVRDVTPARDSFPPPTPAERELHSAAITAVTRWQFEPAEMRRLVFERTNDSRTYWMVKWRHASACRVELTFTFPPEGNVTWTLAALGDVPPKAG